MSPWANSEKVLYTQIFDMRALTIATLVLAAGSLWAAKMLAAEIPRQSPDYSIQLTNGKQIKVSDYRGKVLCLTFILTTCPHCQKTTQLWDSMYPELVPKGFAVVEAALNENPDIATFVSQYKVPFPVGTSTVLSALDYIQWPKDKRPLVPFLVFIDRKGVIRAQYTGVDEAFFDSQQEQHMRDEVEKLLNEGAVKPKSVHKTSAN
jgi:peroxiredoxin